MGSANDILDELASWDSPLANMQRQMPYVVPDQYFVNFTGTLQHLISEEDCIPESLKGIDAMPYVIPKEYFEQFSAQLLDAAKTGDKEQQAKNGKIIPVKRHTTEWKVCWAAAAVLLICIGIGSYKSVVRQQPYNTERALSAVPNSEINAYVQQNIDDFDVDMIVSNMAVNGISIQPKQLDNKEIIEYLNETGWQDVE